MILKKKIPKDFYKLFRNPEHGLLYAAFDRPVPHKPGSVCPFAADGCRMQKHSGGDDSKGESGLVEDETERADESGFLGLTPSAVLDRLVKWGWLSSDFDERLNCYIISFPEYSRMYVELFERLGQEDESQSGRASCRYTARCILIIPTRRKITAS